MNWDESGSHREGDLGPNYSKVLVLFILVLLHAPSMTQNIFIQVPSLGSAGSNIRKTLHNASDARHSPFKAHANWISTSPVFDPIKRVASQFWKLRSRNLHPSSAILDDARWAFGSVKDRMKQVGRYVHILAASRFFCLSWYVRSRSLLFVTGTLKKGPCSHPNGPIKSNGKFIPLLSPGSVVVPCLRVDLWALRRVPSYFRVWIDREAEDNTIGKIGFRANHPIPWPTAMNSQFYAWTLLFFLPDACFSLDLLLFLLHSQHLSSNSS